MLELAPELELLLAEETNEAVEEGATFWGGLVVLGLVDVVAGAAACLVEVVAAAAFWDEEVGAGAGLVDVVFGVALVPAFCNATPVFAAAVAEVEEVAGR